jgi:hypothetical protein
LPEIAAIYKVYWAAKNQIMYIGETSNLHLRWKWHELIRRQLRCVNLSEYKLLYSKASKKASARKAEELVLIKRVQPPWNIQHNPNPRPLEGLKFIDF